MLDLAVIPTGKRNFSTGSQSKKPANVTVALWDNSGVLSGSEGSCEQRETALRTSTDKRSPPLFPGNYLGGELRVSHSLGAGDCRILFYFERKKALFLKKKIQITLKMLTSPLTTLALSRGVTFH